MPHDVSWYAQHTVIQVNAYKQITIDELEEICSKVTFLVENGTAPVHLLADFTHVFSVPTQTYRIKRAFEAFLLHPNMGWAVMACNDNPLIHFVTSVVSQAIHFPLITVFTLDEGIAYLNKLQKVATQQSS
ncbi:MAG: hypothetical protein OHK0046_29370 [Anaerolineae bacterium]